MKQIILISILVLSSNLSYSQGIQLDDSPIYHLDGNIGIGLDNPEKKLDLNGPLRIRGDYPTLYFYRTTNPIDIAKIRYDDVNQNFIFGANNKDIVFQSKLDFGESMRITSQGNVSVTGNLTSSGYLTAGGAARINGDFATLYFHRTSSASDIAKIRYEESNQNFIIGANNKDIVFSSLLNFGESMRITSQGNVCIGTANNNNYKLAVDGTIGAREIKVNLETWSDFVFDSEYNLKELEDVETFIVANNKLPDMPSESEVLENGINLGEMDAKLLQKIEELTLYIIEINKDVKSLKKENLELKGDIEYLKSL